MKTPWPALLAALIPALSTAADWNVTAHVTQIEPSAVPARVYFAIDVNAGSCAAGPWLLFTGIAESSNLPDNVKAMYAGLMAALLSGRLVEVYGNNTGCTVEAVHFMDH